MLAGAGYEYGTPVPVAPQPTNGLAVASMVVSLTSVLICGLPGIVGAIMGHVALKQIRERDETGSGMALTGVIAGWTMFALMVLVSLGFVILVIVWANRVGSMVQSWD